MKRLFYFTALLLLLSSFSESVKLFKAKISSVDVNGTKSFGPKNIALVSKRIKDPLLLTTENENLGRLVSKSNLRESNGFIDFIFRDGDFGVLDSVYINFLKQVTIPNFQPDGVVITAANWQAFKTAFKAKSSFVEKKQLLFEDDYTSIRKEMEKSIYKRIPNQVQQNHKIEALLKSGLESNVKAVLKESKVELSGDVKAQIESIIKTNVSIKGEYVDIELKKEFRDDLVALLGKLKQTNESGNPFLNNYREKFLKNGDLIAVGYSLLVFDITYNTSKVNTTEIKAILDGVATLSETERVNLAAKVYASFSLTKDFKGESKSTKMYLVKYGYHNDIQKVAL